VTDNNKTISFDLHCVLWKINLGHVKLDKFDPINRLIPLSMIPLSGAHFNFKLFFTVSIFQWNVLFLGSMDGTISLIDLRTMTVRKHFDAHKGEWGGILWNAILIFNLQESSTHLLRTRPILIDPICSLSKTFILY
jgi:hypothetical protein